MKDDPQLHYDALVKRGLHEEASGLFHAWFEECKRFAQNADFWRKRCEEFEKEQERQREVMFFRIQAGAGIEWKAKDGRFDWEEYTGPKTGSFKGPVWDWVNYDYRIPWKN